ncbi:DNase I-like protein [Rhizoclosmatium globosum]|uniref:phosphoinositide 5-phosphatase n=1 Tax=Rhizoclosmatium globosum TaxID=329046 RepID=A0A1Y2C7G7_9FUNG|nr:DNase I-like protein [Rhizoclosmatium globosum]|eukprot:ORY42844.1 DNase I-like protein [Rhizoclosmatium globosum]
MHISFCSPNAGQRLGRHVVISAGDSKGPVLVGSAQMTADRQSLGASLMFHAASDAHLPPTSGHRNIYGLLGTVQVGEDVFIGVVLDRQGVGVLGGAPVYRITRVGFFSLIESEFDDYDFTDFDKDTAPAATTAATTVSSMFNKMIGDSATAKQDQQDQKDDDEMARDRHPCSSIMKLFSAGSFYYSPEHDLTRSLWARSKSASSSTTTTTTTTTSPFDSANPTYFWNNAMLAPVLAMRKNELSQQLRTALDNSNMLILAIQGFIGIQPLPSSSSSSPVKLGILSRLSCRNAGTRFNARGIDDDGACSNFVETEVVVETKGYLASFVMVRGSVPVFWEQQGIQIAGHKVELSRGFEITALAFKKHFEALQQQYGHIHIVNLLSGKEGAEGTLVNAFQQHLAQYPTSANPNEKLYYTHFDYHSTVKAGGHEKAAVVLEQLQRHLDNWSYTLVETKPDALQPVLTQQGVLRVNCLDCLDRTNHVEFLASKVMVEKCLREMGLGNVLGTDIFLDVFQNLWADNGDWLSKIYTGTGALKTSMTRRGKQTVMGFFDDAAKSVNRFFINNFQDKHRQEAIDIVLGKQRTRSLLIPNSLTAIVEHDLANRRGEFVSYENVDIFIGTWNVNGKLPLGEPIDYWLQSRVAQQPPHLVMIGIQELIELTAQQFVQADFEKLKTTWEQHLLRVLNQISSIPYVLLRSMNMMALGLFSYVRQDCLDKVRFVEMSVCKTGLGGLGGNKGGVGLSCQYLDTTMVFVTAHLAAGESSVEERNRDYHTISDGLSFKRKSLKDHDLKVWFGDFNYRVSLPNEEARAWLERGNIGPLLSHDQLSIQRARGFAFDGYEEGHINFNPTYKYDNGTMVYDTSEKARCPSWTDRVLFRGKNLQLLEYTHTDSLLMSDHRPVRALLRVKAELIDQNARSIIKEAISKTATPLINSGLPRSSSTKSVGFMNEPIIHSVPPPLPARADDNQQPLIDFTSDGQVWDSLPVKIPATPQQSTIKIAPSSVGASVQWWQVPVDETWIVDEGDATNPFFGSNRI